MVLHLDLLEAGNDIEGHAPVPSNCLHVYMPNVAITTSRFLTLCHHHHHPHYNLNYIQVVK